MLSSKSRRSADIKGIFISYRRQDSQSAAGRLTDHLREQLHGAAIFRDIETIDPGVDFVEAIDRALQGCGILLALIGPRWVSLADASGQRRLEDPNDYTRLEIATALKCSDVRVIPVLVEGAEMPGSDQLPDDLKILARRNAIELTDKRWEFDVSKLVETLNKALGMEPAPKPQPPNPAPPTPAPVPSSSGAWKKWACGIGVLVVLGAIYNAEENTKEVVLPVVPGPAPQYGTPQQPSVAQSSLTGIWQDGKGGRYRMLQQGGQVALQGASAHGAVTGSGILQGNQLGFTYTVNGATYQAVLQVSPDGLILQGQYRNPLTGESGLVVLQRIQ
ncbi:MAG: toll/interleukin-1 receptor domain-containing protein [Dechloromonas sp.]|nr:toll/interleukin-1 receptor domain-containing protein [Candidatus Dechloromonas phosphoritropha]